MWFFHINLKGQMLLEALFRRTDATSDSEFDIIRQEMGKEIAPDI